MSHRAGAFDHLMAAAERERWAVATTASVPPPVLNQAAIREVRAVTGLSQCAFACAYRLPVATVRNWEQGRREPDDAARVLLYLIGQMPEAIAAVLATAPTDEENHD